jgi:hypothetical protein
MDEVNAKVSRMKQRSDVDLQVYLLERTIPVVIGDGGHPHLIDHHHLAVAALTAEGDIGVPVLVVRNWAPLRSPVLPGYPRVETGRVGRRAERRVSR